MRRGKRIGMALLGSVVACAFCSGAYSQVVWEDGFDDYALGSGILGQGFWWAWDGDPAWDSFVTDAQARSGPHSVDIVGDSDSIGDLRSFEMDCGQWILTCYQYVPSDLVETNDTYWIIQSEYADGGPYDWRVQIHHDADTDTLINDFGGETLPSIYDEWVEIRLEVDLDSDYHYTYYGGDLLYEGVWTDSMNGGGLLQLQTIDLFAYGSSSVYYDDFSLEYLGGCEPPDCLLLEVDQLIGGLRSTWTLSGGADGQKGAIVYGFNEGSTQVNGLFGYCADFGIDKVNTNKLICQKRFDANGEVICGKGIPLNIVGTRVLFQGAGDGTCPDPCDSNVLDLVVQ